MNRRSFAKALSAAAALSLLGPLTGCGVTKAQVTAWGADIDQAVSSILTALGYTALATAITTYLTQFNTAVANWNGSSFTAALVSAAQDLEVALGDTTLPNNLVAIADVAINVLITLVTELGGSATTPASPVTARVVLKPVVTVRYTPRVAYKSRAAAVAAFNQAAAQVGVAKIK